MTGAGMMDCKKALGEANGDFDAAIDILRKKGQKISASRADRSTSEGCVFVETLNHDTEGFVVGLGCETDFVAKNEDFLKLGKTILQKAVAEKPANLDTLLAATVEGRSISEHITDLIGKIGEKIEVTAYEHIKGEKIVSYLHLNAKIGVLVALKNTNGKEVEGIGKDVAMQIAAMFPIALDKDDVDASVIEKEIEIGKEMARNEGKPEAMLEKIAQGRLNKFYEERTLLNQEFVKEAKTSVRQYLDKFQQGMTVSGFKRVGIGA